MPRERGSMTQTCRSGGTSPLRRSVAEPVALDVDTNSLTRDGPIQARRDQRGPDVLLPGKRVIEGVARRAVAVDPKGHPVVAIQDAVCPALPENLEPEPGDVDPLREEIGRDPHGHRSDAGPLHNQRI